MNEQISGKLNEQIYEDEKTREETIKYASTSTSTIINPTSEPKSPMTETILSRFTAYILQMTVSNQVDTGWQTMDTKRKRS